MDNTTKIAFMALSIPVAVGLVVLVIKAFMVLYEAVDEGIYAFRNRNNYDTEYIEDDDDDDECYSYYDPEPSQRIFREVASRPTGAASGATRIVDNPYRNNREWHERRFEADARNSAINSTSNSEDAFKEYNRLMNQRTW